MPEAKPKHTRLPWKWQEIGRYGLGIAGGGKIIIRSHVAPGGGWEPYPIDGVFIVRACNSHYELLKSLRDLVFQCKHSLYEERGNLNLSNAEAAIANAEKGIDHE